MQVAVTRAHIGAVGNYDYIALINRGVNSSLNRGIEDIRLSFDIDIILTNLAELNRDVCVGASNSYDIVWLSG